MGRKVLELYGVNKIDGRLREMHGSKFSKVCNGALRKSIKVVENAMKAVAPTPQMKRAIGSRLLKRSREGFGAKAGAAVGKKIPKITVKSLERAGKRTGGGVGIGARNIHWYILGTSMRSTGSKRVGGHQKGANRGRNLTGGAVHSTGRMPAHGFIRAAAQSALPQARQVLQQQVKAGVQALWRETK